MTERTLTRLDPARVAEITALKNIFGAGTDLRFAKAFGALQDLLDERRALLREWRLERLGRDEDPACPLRRDEITVLVYAANGYSNEACAAATGESVHTAKSRRQSAMHKLRVPTVAQAIAVCMASGWITSDDILIPQRLS